MKIAFVIHTDHLNRKLKAAVLAYLDNPAAQDELESELAVVIENGLSKKEWAAMDKLNMHVGVEMVA